MDDAKEPKYRRIQELILQDINSGKFPVGSRLPGREELIMEYQVARATMNQAISGLIEAGVLQATRKRGTFVAGVGVRRENAVFCRSYGQYDMNGGMFKFSNAPDSFMYYLLVKAPKHLNLQVFSFDELQQRPELASRFRRNLVLMPDDEELELAKLLHRSDTLLVNRELAGYPSIGTDQRRAVEEVTTLLLEKLGAAVQIFYLDFDGLSRQLSEARRNGFIDGCGKANVFYRIFSGDAATILEALLAVETGDGRPILLVSNSRKLTGAVLKFSIIRNLPMGKRLFYSDFDNFDTYSIFGEPAISVIQDTMSMGKAALDFLLAPLPPEINLKIPYSIFGIRDCFPESAGP